MKKRIFSLILALLATVTVFSVSVNATDYSTATAKYTTIAPTLDGIKDNVYNNSTALEIKSAIKGSADSVNGTAYFAYDSEYLYVFVEVKDATKAEKIVDKNGNIDGSAHSFASASYNDAVSVAVNFGTEQEKNDVSGVAALKSNKCNAGLYTVLRNNGIYSYLGGHAWCNDGTHYNHEGYQAAISESADGYAAEFKIPFGVGYDGNARDVYSLADNGFSVNVQITDGYVADGSDATKGVARNMVLSNASSGSLSVWGANFGTYGNGYDKLTLTSMPQYKTSSVSYDSAASVLLDGNKDTAYDNSDAIAINQNGLTGTAYFFANDTALYVFLDVKDTTKQTVFYKQDFTEYATPGQSQLCCNDSVAIGFNASGQTVGAAEWSGVTVSPKATIVGAFRPTENGDNVNVNIRSGNNTSGFSEVNSAVVEKADGYTMELELKYCSTGITPNDLDGIAYMIEIVDTDRVGGAITSDENLDDIKTNVKYAYSNPSYCAKHWTAQYPTNNGHLYFYNQNTLYPAQRYGFDMLTLDIIEADTSYIVTVDVNGTTTTETTGLGGAYTLPAAPNMSEGENFLGWEYGENFLPAGASVILTENTTIKAIGLKASTLQGASIRISEPTGLRFTTNIDANSYDALGTAMQSKLGFGMVLFPQDLLGTGTLTKSSSAIKNGTTYSALVIANTHAMSSLKTEENGVSVYSVKCVWSNIHASNYARDVVARGYIDVAYTNGTSNTVYLGTVIRNVKDVAQAAIDSGNYPEGSDARDVLNSFVTDYTDTIVTVNQLGYLCADNKVASVVGTGYRFKLKDAQSNATVFEGKVSASTYDVTSGDNVAHCDFTSYTTPGEYYIEIDNAVSSYTFKIGDDVYDGFMKDMLKTIFYQRCGYELPEGYTDSYAHDACHTSARCWAADKVNGQEVSCGTDLTGGWHDAGDFSVQVTSTSLTASMLMYVYELYPELFDDSVGIPESDNGVPDILDEAKWGVQWLLKMQTASGGVLRRTDAWGQPPLTTQAVDDTSTMYVYPVSYGSTGNMVATCALAARVFEKIDPAFSATCLEAAKRGYAWMQANPNYEYQFPGNYYGATSEYIGESEKDELLWAKAELYATTSDATYLDGIDALIASEDLTGMDYHRRGGMAVLALVATQDSVWNATQAEKLTSAYVRLANLAGSYSENCEWNVPANVEALKYHYNYTLRFAIYEVQMILADRFDATSDHSDVLMGTVNFAFGNNPLNFCYVTGYGENSVQHPHHRMSAIGNMFPGVVVPGPGTYSAVVTTHTNLSDYLSPDTPILKCYYDDINFYRFNEWTVDASCRYIWIVADAMARLID